MYLLEFSIFSKLKNRFVLILLKKFELIVQKDNESPPGYDFSMWIVDDTALQTQLFA